MHGQTPGLKARIPARIIFKLSCFICAALGGMGRGVETHQPPRCSAMTRGVCFSPSSLSLCVCVFVNECAVMSVLAGPLFWMISEGSVHSSLVIGLRGGRFAGPPWAATAPPAPAHL